MRNYIYGVISGSQPGLLAKMVRGLFFVLSLGFKQIVYFRNFLFSRGLLKSESLSKPVISIGNLTWGGTGKTPCVILLIRHLQSLGLKVGVLTRGFMSSSASSAHSDEAQMIFEDAPGVVVKIGANRYQTGRQLLKEHEIDVVLLDDGFQHRQLKRDLDIVLVDSLNPFGNQCLLPAGILREPISSLCRADVMILTKADVHPLESQNLKMRLQQGFPGTLIVSAIHQPAELGDLASPSIYDLNALQGKSVMGICGIADPGSFENLLRSLGANVLKVHAFADHIEYERADVAMVIQDAIKLKADLIVTTSKDAVKLNNFRDEFKGLGCWVLKIKLQIIDQTDEFYRRIHRVLGR